MKKLYCEYCGKRIGNCDCEEQALAELEERSERLEDEYWDDPVVQYGWYQQDIIDSYRREK